MTDSESSSSTKGQTVPGFRKIEVIEVNRNNFQQIWPYLLICVKSADFIAVDLELSGLGGKGLRSKDVQERYKAIKDAASTRSVLSLGIATMKLIHKSEKKKRLRYQTQVFNIPTLSEKPFTIEPNALKFLAKHSFDFNRLIKSGVQFQGKDCPLQTLFLELFSSSSTICLHNGLTDLAFIYQQFYGVELPDTLDGFCNNLADLFPQDYLPIIDSKYLAEYGTRMSASYLEYVFRRCQGDNEIERQNNRFYIDVVFPSMENRMQTVKDATEVVKCGLPDEFPNHPIPIDLHVHVCTSFAHHGFCQNPERCPKLHDVDSAIDLQRIKENKKAFKRKRRYHNVIAESVVEGDLENQNEWKKAKFDNDLKVRDIKEKIVNRLAVTGLHRAGVDAFMTAFAVVYQQRLELSKNDAISLEHVNKLPLSGKDQPLILSHRQIVGGFDNEQHLKTMESINKNRDFVRRNVPKS